MSYYFTDSVTLLSSINSPSFYAVLANLAKHAGVTGKCFPSQETIAKETRLSVRTVKRAIQWLEEKLYIIVKRTRKNNGTNLVNKYTLTIDPSLRSLGYILIKTAKGFKKWVKKEAIHPSDNADNADYPSDKPGDKPSASQVTQCHPNISRSNTTTTREVKKHSKQSLFKEPLTDAHKAIADTLQFKGDIEYEFQEFKQYQLSRWTDDRRVSDDMVLYYWRKWLIQTFTYAANKPQSRPNLTIVPKGNLMRHQKPDVEKQQQQALKKHKMDTDPIYRRKAEEKEKEFRASQLAHLAQSRKLLHGG